MKLCESFGELRKIVQTWEVRESWGKLASFVENQERKRTLGKLENVGECWGKLRKVNES